jgi:hypothetical protein
MMEHAYEFPSRPLRIFLGYLSLMLMIVLLVLGCTHGGPSRSSQQMEQLFEVMINIPVEPKVHLLTEKVRYHRDEYIGINVDNDTGSVLWFTDQRLGFRAYQYNEQSETWRSVDLGSKLGNPRLISIEPGSHDPLPTSVIPVDVIQASGDLRLVITGVRDEGQLFVAYKDIAIID